MNRITCLLIKELTQIRRDRRLFGVLVIAPVFQLLVLGYAAVTDVKEIRLAIRDDDKSYYSREYIRAVTASDYFKSFPADGPAQDDGELLVSGRAGLVLVIPRGFGKVLAKNSPATVQALVDGSDNNFAVQGLNYLQKATRLYSSRLIRVVQADLARQFHVNVPTVTAQSRVWYNPDLKSRNYMVPGVMGILLLVTTTLVTSMALVKEREEGTMEQLMVTPLRGGEIILGKLLPFVVVGFVELTLTLPVMLFVLQVPFAGSFLMLYLVSGLFLLTTLGLGLFVSTLVRTQQQAMLFATFFVAMPFVLLSGFIFPVENMPPLLGAVASLIPMKYYLTCVRGVFLKGVGLDVLWREALVLLVWGVGILALATAKFHKRLD